MLRNVFGLIFVFAALAGLAYWLSSGPFLMTSTKEAQGGKYLLMGAAGLAMIAGIVFGHMHEALKVTRPGQNAGTILRATLNDPGLYRALLASPIVFGGVYTATTQALDPVMALIFSFQNGFFCEALLKKPKP